MLSGATHSTQTQKGIMAKTRDYIHEKVATDEQLLEEKPMVEQIKAKIPADQHEAAAKLDNTIDSVKEKFNERLDEGTERAAEHSKKQTGGEQSQSALSKKIYEATKSPDVKAREEFREKPLQAQLGALANNETKEGLSEILA